MKQAAETVAWFAFGGDRDDWFVPGWAPRDSEWIMSWLTDWVVYWRRRNK